MTPAAENASGLDVAQNALDALNDRLTTLASQGRHRAMRRPTLGAIALDLAAKDPDRVVVTDKSRNVSRGEMVEMALRLGGALRAEGVGKGASIAFQLPNWWETCVINLTAALFGYRIVPLLPIYRAAELRMILPVCAAEVIFLPPADRRNDYRATVAGLDTPPRLVFSVRDPAGRPGETFESLITHPEAQPDLADSQDAKLIMFTSGSTGRPKGVIHSHDSLDAVVRDTAAFWGIDDRDVFYVPSPVAHIGGSIYAFEFPWITGCRTILEDRWDTDLTLQRITRDGVTFMAGATPFLTGLLDAARAAGTQLPGLRRFICGGASVPPELIRDALEAFPNATVSRAYGSTEVPLACPGIRSRAEAITHADTDGETGLSLRLINDAGDDVTPSVDPQNDKDADVVGEIAVRGSQMFIGYLDPADETNMFTADGHVRMGDLGRLKQGRYIVITGRKKDIIIRKGENLSPVEIENALLKHPAVIAAAVVGAPDETRGEMVVAFVQIAAGQQFDMTIMARHLTEYGLAIQKFPERLEILKALPMNAVGKVQKPILRKMAAGE